MPPDQHHLTVKKKKKERKKKQGLTQHMVPPPPSLPPPPTFSLVAKGITDRRRHCSPLPDPASGIGISGPSGNLTLPGCAVQGRRLRWEINIRPRDGGRWVHFSLEAKRRKRDRIDDRHPCSVWLTLASHRNTSAILMH